MHPSGPGSEATTLQLLVIKSTDKQAYLLFIHHNLQLFNLQGILEAILPNLFVGIRAFNNFSLCVCMLLGIKIRTMAVLGIIRSYI
jgi:hypothetical protein